MITIRPSQDRGKANHGWIESKHTFSFADYYDPEHMGFSALRVINDDVLKPNSGFDTHGHRDMEIITFVLRGAIQHKDSEGNIEQLSAGEYQLMSAGSGIYHSEFNASKSDELHLLQIWIQPNSFGNNPGYQQRSFGTDVGLTTIASPTGQGTAFNIKQDATLHQLVLDPNTELNLTIDSGRKVYVHHISGELTMDDQTLSEGDGVKIESVDNILFVNKGYTQVIALVFDLP
ncbi:pirin family protein [Vibrio sp. VB16]|uniref:pirin family protein n=1 Tax=Vibrio sp. VB16 TaxID=2785746 RepID=UPI00189D6B19|nr:pirin family protein [Vibrio sp. VB16]UGA55852.1 pirin family protein [Vibrio sp. VB16]